MFRDLSGPVVQPSLRSGFCTLWDMSIPRSLSPPGSFGTANLANALMVPDRELVLSFRIEILTKSIYKLPFVSRSFPIRTFAAVLCSSAAIWFAAVYCPFAYSVRQGLLQL
jgi:hypothetical protein